MLALLLAIARNLVIPEVMDLVRRRAAANGGAIPTTEEVQAAFTKTITDGIEKGTAWLDAHPG